MTLPSFVKELTTKLVVTDVYITNTEIEVETNTTFEADYSDKSNFVKQDKFLITKRKFQTNNPELFTRIKAKAKEISGLKEDELKELKFASLEIEPINKKLVVHFVKKEKGKEDNEFIRRRKQNEDFDAIIQTENSLVDDAMIAIWKEIEDVSEFIKKINEKA